MEENKLVNESVVEEQPEEKDDFAGKINNVGDDDLPW